MKTMVTLILCCAVFMQLNLGTEGAWFRRAFTDVARAVTRTANDAVDAVKDVVNDVADALTQAKDTVVSEMNKVLAGAKDLADDIKDEVVKSANTIKDIAELSVTNVKLAAEKAAEFAQTATEASLDLIKKGIDAGIDAIMKEFVEKESKSAMNIKFNLYTMKNKVTAQNIQSVANTDYTEYSSSIQGSNFDAGKKTIIMIHGYNNNGFKGWQIDAKNALLNDKQVDVNVVVVNWDKGADSLIYIQSARNTEVVGGMVADFIKELHTTKGASYSNIWVVGHSLGAHAAGYVGEKTPGLGRITGLDPAAPEFQNEAAAKRLDSSDAVLVDVIHTDGDGLGASQAMGDVDFYPNGGNDQPGCKPSASTVFAKIFTGKYFSIKNVVIDAVCDHSRAYYLFIDSIKRSYQQCSYMGYDADKASKGTHRPTTKSTAPYCS